MDQKREGDELVREDEVVKKACPDVEALMREKAAAYELPVRNRKKEIVAWTKVDEEFYEHLSGFSFCLSKKRGVKGTFNGILQPLHSYIWKVLLKREIPINMLVDHKGEVGQSEKALDNRVVNLRLATHRQNAENRKKSEKAQSKYHGVSPENGKWRARFQVNGVNHHLGFYKTELEAARAYDIWLFHHANNKELYFPRNFQNEDFSKEKPFEKRKSKSGYRGVSQKSGKYRVRIKGGQELLLKNGVNTAEEAARVYDQYIVENKMNSKFLNFPEEYPNYVYVPPVKIEKEIVEEPKSIRLLNNNPKIKEKRILIDEEDYDRVKHYTMSIDVKENKIILSKDDKIYALSRFIIGETNPTKHVHHRNFDPYDNRKSNLISGLAGEGGEFRSKTEKLGIHFHKKHGVYVTSVNKNHKKLFYYENKSEENTRRARDLFLLYHLDIQRHLWFEDWTPDKKTEWLDKLNLRENKYFKDVTSF